jgi:hypothetical protein
MIETIIAAFMGICVGTAAPDAALPLHETVEGNWSTPQGQLVYWGWLDEGFHPVDGGHLRILHRPWSGTTIVFATNQPVPAGAGDVFHAQCGAWVVKNPIAPVHRPEPDWHCTTIVDGRVKFLPLERCQ